MVYNTHYSTHDRDVAREFLPRDISLPQHERTCLICESEQLLQERTLPGVIGESHLASETSG